MPTKARTRQPEPTAAQPAEPRTAKVDLPFVRAQFRVPRLRMPAVSRDEVTAAARSLVPSAREAVYYSGLVLLAALEVIEWPVAVVIGVGAAVLGRGHDHGEHEEGRATVPEPRQ
jgi:hypothetical protein